MRSRAPCRELFRTGIRVLFAMVVLSVLAIPVIAADHPFFETGFYEVRPGGTFVRPAAPDLDGDGRAEIVRAITGATGAPGLALLHSQSPGAFAAYDTIPAASQDARASSGDMNGDGHVDVVLIRGWVTDVYLGNGDGSLQPYVSYGSPTSGGGGNRLVDVNGDGNLDVLGPVDYNAIRVHLGNGDGSLAAVFDSPAPPYPGELATGDIDRDGDLDLVVVFHSGSYGVAVMWGDGTGAFDPPTVVMSSPQHWTVALADVNGDGNLDLVNGSVYLPGVGDGTFGPAVAYSPEVFAFPAVVDLTGDGRPDILGIWNSVLLLAPGNGDGSFGAIRESPAMYHPYYPIVTDFQGDGGLDVLVTASSVSTLGVHFGNGDGTFGTALGQGVGAYPTEVALVDVTGDGRLDALTSNRDAQEMSLLRGRGDGQFDASVDIGVGSIQSLTLGDLDSDGRPDVLAATRGSSAVSVFRNEGGSLGPRIEYGAGLEALDVATGDVDGDGWTDAVAVLNGTSFGAVHVFRGQPGGSLAAPVSYQANPRALRVRVVDLNGDSRADVVVLNNRSSFAVFLAGPGGTLGPPTSFSGYVAGSDDLYDLAIGDVSSDGKLDVMTRDRQGLNVVLGNGDGTFQPPYRAGGPGDFGRVFLGDLDRDGRLDVFAPGTRFDNAVTVRLGRGDGTFDVPFYYGAGVLPGALTAGDLDADGDPDIVAANIGYLLEDPPGRPSISTLLNTLVDLPTAVQVSAVSQSVALDRVSLTWHVAGSAGTGLAIQRRGEAAAWEERARATPDGRGMVVFEDREVVPGSRYGYRIVAAGSEGEVTGGEVWVDVPSAFAFALHGPRPNPSPAEFRVSLSLPTAEPATLELLDLQGRRIVAQQVGSLGPGTHLVDLAPGRRLPIGLYLVQLTQGNRRASLKATVVD